MGKTRAIALQQRDVEVAQAAGIIALGNVASRVLGLVRDMVKADLFGASGPLSAYEVAAIVPTMIYDLLVGGMSNAALVPVLSAHAVPERRAELWHLLNVLFSVVVVTLSAFVLLVEALAPQVVWLLGGGLTPILQVLAARLLRICVPAVLFLNLAGVVSATLYALKRFTLPAFTAAVFNAAVVVAALLLSGRYGVVSLAVGLLAGSLLQILLQVPGLRDARWRFKLDLNHPALRRIMRLYVPILLGLVVDQFAVGLSYNLASRTGDQSINWMKYSATLIQFPLGLVVTAVSIATLPTLSQQANLKEADPFQATLARGLRLVLSLVIPATAGLFVLANLIVALIFEHGDFTPVDTMATAEALRYALLGLLFAAVDQPLIFAFYARKDTLTPALVGVGTTLLYILMALIPWRLGILTLPLLVLVNSFKLTAHALAMLVLTQRRLGGLGDHGLWSLTLKAALASLAMAVAVWSVMRALAAIAPAGLLGELLIVGGAGGVGVAAYGLLALVLRIEEIRLIRVAVADGLNRLTGSGW
ncbi:MAG: murein biosynthesis integral membrane protein MurJ [Anaerolineae bacterium]